MRFVGKLYLIHIWLCAILSQKIYDGPHIIVNEDSHKLYDAVNI